MAQLRAFVRRRIADPDRADICYALTLDVRGLPMDYTPNSDCG
jgi:hypothetical protein